MKKRMQKGNDMGARYAVIVGEDVLAKGVASLKNLQTGAQQEVAIDAVAAAIRA